MYSKKIRILSQYIPPLKLIIRQLPLVFCLLCFVLLLSCNKNRVYEDYQAINNYVWKYDSTLNFEINIEDTSAVYNAFLYVRHIHKYKYSNIWFFTKIIRPDFSFALDTVECILAKDNGQWLGDGLGDIWDYKHNWYPYNSTIFNKKGKYKIQIKQAMRDSLLIGIMDIGVGIYKVTY